MKVALLGCGTVGSQVLHMLDQNPQFEVRHVLVRSRRMLQDERFTTSFERILRDDQLEVVVEMMGGVEPAYGYLMRVLEQGKAVVSANKAVLSTRWCSLCEQAQKSGVAIRCTASVGGGIPWLYNLNHARGVDRILRIGGIMNGTSNFVLDVMERQKLERDQAVALAQHRGYAEADPTDDLTGSDVRRKTVLSANRAFDICLDENSVPAFGIQTVTAQDLRLFSRLGYVCRLIGFAQRKGETVCAFAEPALFEKQSLFAGVKENNNLIYFEGEQLGTQAFFGQGAGGLPTACNVVQDLLDLATAAPGALQCGPHCSADNSTLMRRYLVRTTCDADRELSSAARERLRDAGTQYVLTKPISAQQMHQLVQRLKGADPFLFFAAIEEEEEA